MIYNFISLSVLNSFLCVILEILCGVSVCLHVFVVYWVTYECIICAFVCVWVWVCVHMCRGHRMTGSCSTSLCLIAWNLKLAWQPVIPGDVPVSIPDTAGVTRACDHS